MTIENINEIQDYNIICKNNDEVMKCKSILDKLGLEIYDFDDNEDRKVVKFSNYYFFSNYIECNKNCENISFLEFKQQTEKFYE